MSPMSLVCLKKIMSSVSSSMQEKLIHFLPKKTTEELLDFGRFEDKIILEDISYDQIVDLVHYSWFLPTLKTYKKKEISLFLLTLSEKQKEKLASLLQIKIFPKTLLTSFGKNYLKKHLLISLIGEEKKLLPYSFLFASPLNTLLKLSKKQLISLIDFLGLYDLKNELRKIVDPKLLKKIYTFLSKEKLTYLQNIRNSKQKLIATHLYLHQWDGEKKSLSAMIHRAGLIRFAKALSIEDANLQWYLFHILDIGRGLLLQKLCEKKEKENIANFISKQIINLIKPIMQPK